MPNVALSPLDCDLSAFVEIVRPLQERFFRRASPTRLLELRTPSHVPHEAPRYLLTAFRTKRDSWSECLVVFQRHLPPALSNDVLEPSLRPAICAFVEAVFRTFPAGHQHPFETQPLYGNVG